MSNFIVINPVITGNNTNELFEGDLGATVYPLMESTEHAALYRALSQVPIRMSLMNVESSDGFSDGDIHPVEGVGVVVLNIGVGFGWGEGVLSTMNKTIGYMINKNAKMYWFSGFDAQPGAKELFLSLSEDFDVSCVNIPELGTAYKNYLHGGK
jgi:hypothetical protein